MLGGEEEEEETGVSTKDGRKEHWSWMKLTGYHDNSKI